MYLESSAGRRSLDLKNGGNAMEHCAPHYRVDADEVPITFRFMLLFAMICALPAFIAGYHSGHWSFYVVGLIVAIVWFFTACVAFINYERGARRQQNGNVFYGLITFKTSKPISLAKILFLTIVFGVIFGVFIAAGSWPLNLWQI